MTRRGTVLAATVLAAMGGMTWRAAAQAVPGPDAPKQPATAAPTEALPAAEAVFEAYVKALGGHEAMDKITNRVMEGRISNSLGSYNAMITIQQAPPNKIHLALEIPGYGIQESGYDGTTAWVMDPNTGARILSGPDLEEAKDADEFWGEASYKTRYKKIEVLERVVFEKRPAYKVRAVGNDDKDRMVYFDAETGLALGIGMTRDSGGKPAEVMLIFLEYKESGGTKWPSKVVQRVGKLDATFEYDKIETNVKPAPTFDLPSEVKKAAAPK
jgi:hypothetical protein